MARTGVVVTLLHNLSTCRYLEEGVFAVAIRLCDKLCVIDMGKTWECDGYIDDDMWYWERMGVVDHGYRYSYNHMTYDVEFRYMKIGVVMFECTPHSITSHDRSAELHTSKKSGKDFWHLILKPTVYEIITVDVWRYEHKPGDIVYKNLVSRQKYSFRVAPIVPSIQPRELVPRVMRFIERKKLR